MAALKGWLHSAKGREYSSVSRLSNSHMTAELSTGDGLVAVVLRADGSYTVAVNGEPTQRGNVNE